MPRLSFRSAGHLPQTFLLSLTCFWALAPARAADSQVAGSEAAKMSQSDRDAGQQLVRAYCTRCHGLDATGARAPDLSQRVLRHANSDAALERVIRDGIPATGMAGFDWFPDRHIKQVIGFLQHRRNATKPPVLTGDIARGETLFRKHNCATCHWTGPSGGRRGPDLSVSRGRIDYVRKSIMNPGTDVDRAYQQVSVLTDDGRVLKGMRLSENSYFVQVIDEQDQLYTISKADVEEITRPAESLMPSYKELLNEQELEDLIAYVFSLRKE